jgi:molecular chaperone DnaK (HSP70)
MAAPAISSICGFDIGTENCYIGIARQGGLEIILNDYSQRSTPGYVCITDTQRELGVSAKQKQNMYISTTFYNLRRLIGRSFEQVQVEEDLPFPIEKAANGEAAVRVTLNNEELLLTATQLLAMVFTKLRQISNQPTECVINCPGYFTDSQRRALHDAATIAGLSPLMILSDLSSVALYYCFYRLNPRDESNHILAFLDVGASSTQCCVVLYEAKKATIQVLASESDSNLGGRDFDAIIADYFIQRQKLKLNKRSRIRLLAECEKLKKQMSANSNELPINIECLYEDRDFAGRLDRATFEQLCEEHLKRINGVMRRANESAAAAYAKLTKENATLGEFRVEICEVVGGSSRIPSIKKQIREVFGVDATATMNADEAVALGCTLQCALLSPNFKVARELQVLDYQPYQINCRYWHVSDPNPKVYPINPLFARGDHVPFTRQMIITCHSLPIQTEIEYVNAAGEPVQIGQFLITSAQPLQFSSSKLKIRVRLGNSGLIAITSATLKVEDKSDGDEGAGEDAAAGDDANAKEAKPKTRIRDVELQLEYLQVNGRLNEQQLDECKNLENNLVLADKNWRERSDARNELEEFVYEWRDRLETGEYDAYLQPSDKQDFAQSLRSMQNWLQDDEDSGETQTRQVYVEKLDSLRVPYSQPLLFRRQEHDGRDAAFERLAKSIQFANKLVVETDEQLDPALLGQLKSISDETQLWFEEKHQKFVGFVLHQSPTTTVKDILAQADQMEKAIKPVVENLQRLRNERAKQEEEEKKKLKEAEAAAANGNGSTTNDDGLQQPQPSPQATGASSMEVE